MAFYLQTKCQCIVGIQILHTVNTLHSLASEETLNASFKDAVKWVVSKKGVNLEKKKGKEIIFAHIYLYMPIMLSPKNETRKKTVKFDQGYRAFVGAPTELEGPEGPIAVR